MGRPRIEILPETYFLAAVWLLIPPLRLLFSWAVAVAVHEFGHMLAVRCCGGQIHRIRVLPLGMELGIAPLPPQQEFLCALAGPAAGILLLPFLRWIPELALFGLLQTVCNLLPIYPLDGGRALRCITEWIAGQELAYIVSYITSVLTLLVLVILGLVGCCGLGLGFAALIPALVLGFKCLGGKIPCKRRSLGLQ